MDLAFDPGFATNRYYYVFYTLGSPEPRSGLPVHRQRGPLRHGRRERVRDLPGPGRCQLRASWRGPQLRQRRQALRHDRRALQPDQAQSLSSPRGKLLRFNADGTVPTDNPFYDGAGPNVDAIWALGPAQSFPGVLRRPHRQALHRRRGGQRLFDRRGGGPCRRSRRQLRLAGLRRLLVRRQSGLHQPDLRLRPQRTGRGDHRRLRLPGQPVPGPVPGQLFLCRLRAELDQAADPRRQRQRDRRPQLRAAGRRRPTGPTATSSISARARTARSTTWTSGTRTPPVRSGSARSAGSGSSRATSRQSSSRRPSRPRASPR